MTEKQKEEVAALSAFVILVILLLLILWKALAGPGGPLANGATTVGGINVGGPDVGGLGGDNITLSPYAPGIGGKGNCCCGGGGGCPITPNTAQSIAQMVDGANASLAQIYAAGNNTVQAVVESYMTPDPIYKYTVG